MPKTLLAAGQTIEFRLSDFEGSFARNQADCSAQVLLPEHGCIDIRLSRDEFFSPATFELAAFKVTQIEPVDGKAPIYKLCLNDRRRPMAFAPSDELIEMLRAGIEFYAYQSNRHNVDFAEIAAIASAMYNLKTANGAERIQIDRKLSANAAEKIWQWLWINAALASEKGLNHAALSQDGALADSIIKELRKELPHDPAKGEEFFGLLQRDLAAFLVANGPIKGNDGTFICENGDVRIVDIAPPIVPLPRPANRPRHHIL